jgi:integrase
VFFLPFRQVSGRKVGRNLADLAATSASLKARGFKGKLVDHDGRFCWRATVTTPDGKRGSRRIPLGLQANGSNLQEADNRIVQLVGAIKEVGYLPKEMPWDAPKFDPEASSNRIKVSEAIEQLKADFWKGKVRTTAAERTWERVEAEVRRLPAEATLTMDLLVAVGEQQEPGSRTRQEFLKIAKRMAKLVGLDGTAQLDEIRTPYEPAPREVPDDQELLELLNQIPREHRWAWPTWALSTYGCRPCETFSIRPQADGTCEVLTVKRKGKLPTWRTGLAIPLIKDYGSRSVPWDVPAPKDYCSKEAKRQLDMWQGWLGRQQKGLTLYSLRHAWAIRTIKKGLNASLAAKCMGHSLDVHHRTYHRWLSQADVAAVAAQLMNQD